MVGTKELEIVYLSPEELTPYENNARVHSKDDIEAIKASIREAGGFFDPIGIWGENNLIVEGHGRRQAAIELGLEKVPCIRLDQMTDEQRRVYTLTHNRTSELSGWDFDMLENELDELNISDVDLSEFGFDCCLLDNDQMKDDILKMYEENAEQFLLRRRIIITYPPEQHDKLRELLGINDQKLKVTYKLEDIIGK